MNNSKIIILGVTSAESIKLLGGIPQALLEADWDVHIVSSPNQEIKLLTRSKIAYHTFMMKRDISLISDTASLIKWILLVHRVRPNFVVVGTPKAALLGLVASWLLAVPNRVYVLRGLRLETTSGIRRLLLYIFERITSAMATSVISVSNSLALKYSALGLREREKIFVLGQGSSHGVNVNRFSPKNAQYKSTLARKLGLEDDIPILGFVGRFSEDKGAATLLTTRKLLVRLGIDHQMIIIGVLENSFSLFQELNKIGRKVKFIYNKNDIEKYYPLMDILLLPTKREGFPNVVLEASSTGIPVITTDATGAVDAVENLHTGLIVPKNSPEAFAEAVAMLLSDKTLRTKMGLNGRIRVIRHFDEAEVSKNVVNFFDSFLRN